MTKLSDRFLRLADRMVGKFGVTSAWKLIQTVSFSSEDDPTAYEESEKSEILVDLAVVTWKESDYDGKTVVVGDKPAIMPAKSGYPIPSIDDVLESVTDGTRYRIVAPIKIFSVNGITVAYKLNLRG